MKNYFNVIVGSFILLMSLVCPSAFGQSGLSKNKDELLKFIRRPEYSSLYSEVSEDVKSVVTFSRDLNRGIYYSLNSYNRCDGEIMSERLTSSNYQSTISFLKGYLKALNYEADLNKDNSYKNTRERITATIEQTDGWLNIVFKKY